MYQLNYYDRKNHSLYSNNSTLEFNNSFSYSRVGMNADNGASLHTIPVTLSVLKEYSEFYSINVYMILLVRK
jgi:hypothetical protein